MTNNVGVTDRVFRVLVGIVILSMAFIGPQTAWGYVGLIPLITGVLGACPVYSILGRNTCENSGHG